MSATKAGQYSSEFYNWQVAGSLRSARAIAPLVQDLIRPGSVCDVGCGVGTWLRAFVDLGVDDICGFDGPWVRPEMMKIPADSFHAKDLSQPLEAGRTFDLACSLEVAEHVPMDSADQFVANLAALAPVILFSAAIPHQGGTGHVNEQWPTYWRAKFAMHGFIMIDCIRPKIWDDEQIEWWYRQNIFIFANAEALDKNPALKDISSSPIPMPIDVVHPDFYTFQYSPPEHLIGAVKKLPRLFADAITKRIS